MARSDQRISVYPEKDSTDELGTRAPELNSAIDRYALLRRLMRADEKTQYAVWSIVGQMLDAVKSE